MVVKLLGQSVTRFIAARVRTTITAQNHIMYASTVCSPCRPAGAPDLPQKVLQFFICSFSPPNWYS